MLVLTRKESESIQIGKDITIMVVKISGERVSIGIEAPEEVKIKRTELQDKE